MDNLCSLYRPKTEKRNVAISLEEARKWYMGDNYALRAIALKPYSERGKWDTLHKLAIMAKYYNGDWEMKAGKTGYFIGKSSMGGSAVVQQVKQYAGIVYFKNAQDAKEAAKLLFDELNLLF